jgi:hypothetical protein
LIVVAPMPGSLSVVIIGRSDAEHLHQRIALEIGQG